MPTNFSVPGYTRHWPPPQRQGQLVRDSSQPKHRLRLAGALAVLLTLAGVAALALSSGKPEREPSTLSSCQRLRADSSARRCYTAALSRMLPSSRPTRALSRISRKAVADRGFLGPNCHVLMHTVGRRYAARRRLTFATLMDYLPRNQDLGCSAGFAHGLITQIAPQIDVADPRRSAALGCGRLKTRLQTYSCIHGFGHAFMRLYSEQLEPALKLCRALGQKSGPDCAQGAYHDYWLAAVGLDDTRAPKGGVRPPDALCARQPREFVRPCWYRALVETRPTGYRTKSRADLLRICRGLGGVQRYGCITAASVIGSPNPLKQFRVCAYLPHADVAACLRGVKVQNLIGTPAANQLVVIRRCAWFRGPAARDCYEWFGRTLAVISNGRFRRSGCPRLARTARAACLRGARRMYDALVTFS